MKVDVLMPKMGESITEGRILKWLKQPGDAVDRDETILEIATDKVDTEVPAPQSGVLVQILAQEGETVEVGLPIGVIETDAANAEVAATPAPKQEAPAVKEEAPVAAAAPAPVAAPAAQAVPAPAVASSGSPRFYSPVVMRIAAEHGLGMAELESIPGSGMGGRVSKNDVLAWLAQRPAASASSSVTPAPVSTAPAASAPARPAPPTPVRRGDGVEVIQMSNMHRLMAEHMVKSVQISPHVAVVSEVDMTRIVKFRDKHAAAYKQREGVSLTYMPFIAEATIKALKDFPWMNSSVDADTIILKNAVNLGIAVAMDDGGLIVPVVKNADMLNVVGLSRSIADVASRARIRKLQPEEIQDGTFTITNFGVFGNLFGTPIINQPQVGILGVGAVQKRPVVVERDGEDTIAIRSMMLLSLSFDHRIIDGALGGRFIERVKAYLEDFDLDSI
ncbi:MAG TPA: dihydrolipoamide acetyltransferase family protein [Bacteroidota bacterium]|nr:dihydrolipoamide acetyltransferase family protein [Bacteroidota bacterium]